MDIYYNLRKDFEILPRLAVRTYVSPRGKVTHILIGIFKFGEGRKAQIYFLG